MLAGEYGDSRELRNAKLGRTISSIRVRDARTKKPLHSLFIKSVEAFVFVMTGEYIA